MKGQATGLLIFLTISFLITKCSPSEKNEDASQLDHQETSSIRQTTYVRVKGYKEKGVLIRKGIPYGSDTSGGNRWKTKKTAAWKGTREARTKSTVALQSYNLMRKNLSAQKMP